MRDAIERYEIQVESGSSSYDSNEQRRNDSLAVLNILQTGKKLGSNVDVDE